MENIVANYLLID